MRTSVRRSGRAEYGTGAGGAHAWQRHGANAPAVAGSMNLPRLYTGRRCQNIRN